MSQAASSTSAFSVRNVRRIKKVVPKDPLQKIMVVSQFRSRDPELFDPYVAPTMYGDYTSRGRMVRTITHD
jgi:hypothetical protein